MKFKAAIFDMDGTLLESMHIWRGLAPAFLKKHGVTPPPDFEIHASVPSVRGAVRYMIETFSLPLDEDAEARAVYAELTEFYTSKVTLKPGIKTVLNALRQAGLRAGVLTATERFLAEPALKNAGLQEYFTVPLLSGAEHNISKSSPQTFMMMADALGARPQETIVFEDALYAAKTAAAAGFAVAAVHDDSEPEQNALARTADWYCRDWHEFPLDIFSCSDAPPSVI